MGVDDSHILGSKGGSSSIDIGYDTDLATALYVNSDGNIQVEWQGGYHASASAKTGLAADTRAPIDWNYKTTHGGTKVVGTLPNESPYISVCYWQRVA